MRQQKRDLYLLKKDKKVTDGATDDSGLRIALNDEGTSTKRVQSGASDLEA